MSVIKAIRASCSLPVIFTPIVYKGDLYVDGGIYDHFPIHYFEKKNMSNVVGVLIDSHTTNKNIDTLFQYLQRLLTSTMNVAFRKNIEKELHGNIVILKLQDAGLFKYDTFELSLTCDMIDDYFMTGYNEAKRQLHLTSPL
jgi:NTE family protein